MSPLDRLVERYDRWLDATRKRSRVFDHAWRARDRYQQVLGERLAAAISYYGFFAAFSLTVLAYSILGYVLESRNGVVDTINSYLSDNLPWIDPAVAESSRGTVTLIGSITLVLTGRGWVEALRSSQRAVWRLEQHPGNLIIRWLVDLGMLVGLGLLLGLSLATSTAITNLIEYLVATPRTVLGSAALRWSGPVLEFCVNVGLATALLTAVPRLKIPWRRLVPAAVMVAAGIQVLNTVGRFLISHTEHNPAYSIVAGAVGMLVYLYLINQLILYGAAFCATGARGRVIDLAARVDVEADPPYSGAPGGVSSRNPG